MLSRNWESLIKPYRVAAESREDPRRFGKVVVEPLEKGFGVTLGNALRRVLLSSIQGAAVTLVRINGGDVLSEFSTIEGVSEDVTEIILNLKTLQLRLHGQTSHRVKIEAKGPCVVNAGMIDSGGIVEVLDPSTEICTLGADAQIEIELLVETGKGYVPAQGTFLDQPRRIGDIALDAQFSPIKRVAFQVESTRVGQLTDYDKLMMEVETNGAISPRDAVGVAAQILRDQLEPFMNFTVEASPTDPERKELASSSASKEGASAFSRVLFKRVSELDLNVRCYNCLQNSNITFVGDLVRHTEADLLKTPNFGRKSLNEIKEKLKKFDLELGMDIPDWPPEDIDSMILATESESF